MRTKTKKALLAALSAVMALSLCLFAACGGGGGGNNTDEITIAFEKTSITMQVSEEVHLKVTTNSEEDVDFTSSAPGVATVTPDGFVTGVSAGSAVITAEVEGKSATCNVQVLDYAPVLTLSETAISLKEGDTKNVNPSVTSNGSPVTGVNYTWTSDDDEIASVDSGIITAVKEGQTEVTCYATFTNPATTDEVTLQKTVSVTVTAIFFNGKVNRYIPGDNYEPLNKDTFVLAQSDDINCKINTESILDAIWSFTYQGKPYLLATEEFVAKDQAFAGFDIDQNDEEIDAYYRPAVPVKGSDNKIFLAFASASYSIGSYGENFTYETPDEGFDFSTQLDDTGILAKHHSFVGMSLAEAKEQGLDRLVFYMKIDTDAVGSVNPVMCIDETEASLQLSGDVQRLTGANKLVLTDMDGNNVPNITGNTWYKLEIHLDQCTDELSSSIKPNATLVKGFNVRIKFSSAVVVHFADAEIYSTADLPRANYTVEHYLYNTSTSQYEKNDDLTQNLQGPVNEVVTAQPLDIKGYAFNSVYEENDVSKKLVDGETVTMKLYYDVAAPIEIEDSESNARFYQSTAQGAMSNGGITYTAEADTFQGKDNVYHLTGTGVDNVTRVVGLTSAEAAEAGLQTLVFYMYIDEDEDTDVYIQYNGAKGSYRVHNKAEYAEKNDGVVKLFDAAGRELEYFNVLKGWVKVVVDLSQVGAQNSCGSGYSARINFELHNIKSVYIADAKLTKTPFDQFVGTTGTVLDTDGVLSGEDIDW